MDSLFKRSPLVYPSGVAHGFDPNHIASAGVSFHRGFSGVCLGGGLISVLSGQPGAITGTPVLASLPTGPGVKFANSTDALSFATNSTAAATSITFAGVVWFDSLNSGSTFNSIISTEPNFNGVFLDSSGGNWTMQVNNTSVSAAIIPTVGTPYFFITSNKSGAGGNVNFLFLNLATGQLTTKVVAATASAAATSGTYWLGNNTGASTYPMLGSIAAVMYAPKYMSLPSMKAWAADPWAFWYPQPEESWVGVTAGNVTLTAAFGSFTETGEPVIFDMKMPGAFGSFTETGEAATLGPGIVAEFGSFAETGEPVIFDTKVAAAFGSFMETGEPVAFDTKISAAFGSFAETGEPALFDVRMPGAFGGYVLTGEDATLTASSGSSVVITANFGAFVFSGEDATLIATATADSIGSSISGGYFSRKKWHELVGQIAAERAQARAVKNASQRKAIAPAGLLADQALKAARDAEESAQVAADLRAMTSALQAAAGAKSLNIAIAHANEAKEFARSAMAAMKAYQELEDDEEESIALLLMH